jgi:hypothetical protein
MELEDCMEREVFSKTPARVENENESFDEMTDVSVN